MMYRSGAVSNSHFTRHSSASESLQGRRNQQGSLYSSRSSSGRRLPPSSVAAGLATTVPTKLGQIAQPVGTVPPSALLHQRKHSSTDLLAHSHHSFNWRTPGDKEEVIPQLMDPHLSDIIQRAFTQRSQPLRTSNTSSGPLSSIISSSSSNNKLHETRRLLLAVFQLIKGQVITYHIYPTGELTELTERRRRLLRRYYDRGRQLVVLYLDEDNAEHYTSFPLDLSQFAGHSGTTLSQHSSRKENKTSQNNTTSRQPPSSKSFSNSSTTSSSTGVLGPGDINSPSNSSLNAVNNPPKSVTTRKRTPRVYRSPPFCRRSKSNDDVYPDFQLIDKTLNGEQLDKSKADSTQKSRISEPPQRGNQGSSSTREFTQSQKRLH